MRIYEIREGWLIEIYPLLNPEGHYLFVGVVIALLPRTEPAWGKAGLAAVMAFLPLDIRTKDSVNASLIALPGFPEKIQNILVDPHIKQCLRLGQFNRDAIPINDQVGLIGVSGNACFDLGLCHGGRFIPIGAGALLLDEVIQFFSRIFDDMLFPRHRAPS